MLPPAQLSRLVAAKALRTVPYPLLGENTLVISDSIILAPDDTGRLALMVRCDWSCSDPVPYYLKCWLQHCALGSKHTRHIILVPDDTGRLALMVRCCV